MADAQAIVEIIGKQSVSGPAGVAAGALSALESAAGKAGSVLGGLATTTLKVASSMAALGATGIIAGLTAATTAAAGFEKQMSAVAAVSGASAQQLKDLSALALKLGADTSFSASQSAQGIEELVKAGVSIADVMGGAAKASLDLAAAGGVDVATAAEIASNAMNVFNIKGKDMAHVADEIAGAANASAIDVNDYKFSLSAAGAVAATVGINFDDLSTAIAVMGQAGIKGSDAGTSLKTMLLNLTPSTKAQIAEAKELGIVTADGANKFFDASGKAKSMAEIAQVLQTATKDLTEQQRLQALQTLFGTDAIRAAAIMARAGAGGFNEMAAAIGKVSASDVANTRLDNLAGSIEKFKGSAETAAITVGQHLTPPLRRLVDIATDLVNRSLPDLDRFGTVLGTTFDRLIDRAQHLVPHLGAVRGILDGIGGRAGQGIEAARRGISALVAEFEKLVEVVRPTVATLLDMGRTAGPMVQRFADMALPILKMVGQYLTDYVINQVQFLTTYVLPAFYDVAVQTFGFFRDVGPTLAHIAGVLHEQLGVTLIWLADEAWPNLLSIARQTVEWFDRELLPLIPAIADALRVNLGGALYWLATVGWPALLNAATTALTWIQSTGIPMLTDLVGWLGPKLSAALSWLTQTGWPTLLTAGATVSDWVTGTAIPALSDLVDWLGPKIAAAVQWLIDTGWPTLVSAASAVTDWVTGTALPALSALWDWLSPKLSAALDWLTNTGWPALVSAGQDVTSWIQDAAIPLLSSLWDWLSPKLSAAVGWLTETGWPMLVSAATAFSGWIQDEALPLIANLWSWLEEKTRPAVQWFIDTGWPELARLGRIVVNMWSDMVDWVGRLWDKLQQSGVVDSVTTSLGLLWDAGKILVETFWPEMTSGAGDAFTAIDPLVTLLKGAAGFLRAFAEGVHAIAEGLRAMKDAAESMPDWLKNAMRNGAPLLGPAGGIIPAIVGPGQAPAQAQAPSAGQSSQPGTSTTGTASATKGKIDNSSRSSFVRTAYPYMLEAAGGNKDLAEMMLAAAISENGDVGKGGDFVGNNFFGIKGKGPSGKSNTLDTWEMEGGRRVNQKAEFAAYDDPVQGFQGFMDFLRKNSRYAGALSAFQQTGDAQTLFNGINAAGYATDPNWARTIGNIRANQVAPVTATVSTTMSATATDAALTPLHEIIAVLGKDVPDAAATAQQSIASFAAHTGQRFQILAADSQVDISEMADGLVTQITDAAGNVTSTVTDMNGNVVRQFASMADGTLIATGNMGTSLVESLDQTSGLIDTTMTDAAGNVVETVTDMAGTVLLQTATMANTAGANISAVGTAASNAKGPLDALGATFDNPTTGAAQAAAAAAEAARQYAMALDDVAKAADNADGQVADLFSGSFDFSFGGGRASGGRTRGGTTYLVGEDGPELWTSQTDGMVLPNAAGLMSRGGNDGGVNEDSLAKKIAAALPTGGHTIIVNGVADPQEAAREVMRLLKKEDTLRGVRR